MLLLFPNGQFVSSRWRLVGWIGAAGLTLTTVGTAFAPGPLEDLPLLRNPLGVSGTTGRILDAMAGIGWLLLVVTVVLGTASQIVRFRRSSEVERQQLKWFMFATLVLVGSLVPGVVAEAWQWAGLGLAALPLAIGMAVLRYRLYDIDLVINRTLVYATLSAALLGVYALCVVVIPRALRVGGDSELVVAGSTLAVAALFQPLRRRIQGFIDRRFYRRKYDAARTVEAFSSRLRNEVDLEAMRADLLAAVQDTMQPRRVSLWLRSGW
jgi:hypothetical protein